LGIPVEPFDELDHLDIAIDGADQVTTDHWAVKGGHGAHLREKIVAAAADRFVVIVTPDKLVDALHPPVPLELVRFGVPATLRQLGHAALRAGAPTTPDGGVLADYEAQFDDPAALAARLDATPGVAGHGLFSPALVDDVIVGGERG
jgi:ribose 5-phosphate isomerase A